jgi:hypothetical protein
MQARTVVVVPLWLEAIGLLVGAMLFLGLLIVAAFGFALVMAFEAAVDALDARQRRRTQRLPVPR